ncbi:hypothetical protein AM593_00154, partial [Mytilus galloprovincialis]
MCQRDNNPTREQEIAESTNGSSAQRGNRGPGGALQLTPKQKWVLDKPAFFATLSTKMVSLRTNHVVKFNNIKTNIGGGYDASTGVFTVRTKGTYEFAVNFITNWSRVHPQPQC